MASTLAWCCSSNRFAPPEWTRKFFHPERGILTIEDILPAFAWHSRHHTAHITELRKRLGWQTKE